MFNKKIKNKIKAFLIVASIDLVLTALMFAILFAFFKPCGKSGTGYIFTITNQIIDEHSSLEDDDSFIYKRISDQGEEKIKFSSDGDSAFLGTYEPYTYVYGTEDTNLFISFKLTGIKINKVIFNKVGVCNEDGENVSILPSSSYTTYKKDGWYILKYSKVNITKYVYSVTLTYYL